MTDLLKAAQVVIDSEQEAFAGMSSVWVKRDAIETLRQAVEQAKVVEAVAWIEYEQFAINATPLEVVRGHTLSTCWHYQSERPVKRVEANFLLPLYTTPPSVDALIAEIDWLIEYTESEYVYDKDIKAILDKYRSVK